MEKGTARSSTPRLMRRLRHLLTLLVLPSKTNEVNTVIQMLLKFRLNVTHDDELLSNIDESIESEDVV